MLSPLQTPSLPKAVAAEQTYLQIPSQPEWIAPTVEYLKEKAILCGACHESRANKLMLALQEALTNSVVHGNLELSSDLKEQSDNAFAEALAARSADPYYGERLVEVRVEYDGERCQWTFTDQGKGFDVDLALAQASELDPEMVSSSGRGILLMRAFLDEVRYEAGGRRVVLTLSRTGGEEKRRTTRRLIQRPVRVTPIHASIGMLLNQLNNDNLRNEEQRTYPREVYTARIRIQVASDRGPVIGFSRDLSRSGISFLTTTPLAREDVILSLPQPGRAMLRVVARVMRCNQVLAGIYDVGARFVDVADH